MISFSLQMKSDMWYDDYVAKQDMDLYRIIQGVLQRFSRNASGDQDSSVKESRDYERK